LFLRIPGEIGLAGGAARRSRYNRGMARTTRSKPDRPAATTSGEQAPNAIWFKPVMFGFMLLGLIWIIVFYVSNGALPIPDLGSANILVGFGILFDGFLMTTRWR
jgi:hypothetical protein